jgi:hypothetical protein
MGFNLNLIKMNRRFLFLMMILLCVGSKAICQRPPEEFFTGMDKLTINLPEAKQLFLTAAKKDTTFHGTYHFLGVVATREHKPDSAIYYYKKSIVLNTGNVNHTTEMTWVRLINEYVYQKDFKNAFDAGWEAYQKYPESQSILLALKDACLWAFYVKYDKLDPNYLSEEIKDEYVVNSINQEYLIVRKLRVNDNYLSVTGQKLISKNNASYDVLICAIGGTKETKEVSFKINWDMNKWFGGKPAPADDIDAGKPIYERLGALLQKDNKLDVRAEIEKMMK